MKISVLLMFVFMPMLNCAAQSTETLKTEFIKEFVNYNKEKVFFEENNLFVLGDGENFSTDGINVVFLTLPKIKEKVALTGEFYVLSMEDFYFEENFIKTSFTFLFAKKNYKTDFTVMPDDEGEHFCLKQFFDSGKFEIFWCN